MKNFWPFNSRKARVAMASIASIILARLLKHFGFTDEEINVITGGIVVIAGVWIGGIAHEDAAQKSSPAQQVNVGSTVRNQQPTTTTSDRPPDPPPQTDPPTPAEAAPPTPKLKPVTLTADEIRWLREQAAKAKAQTPA